MYKYSTCCGIGFLTRSRSLSLSWLYMKKLEVLGSLSSTKNTYIRNSKDARLWYTSWFMIYGADIQCGNPEKWRKNDEKDKARNSHLKAGWGSWPSPSSRLCNATSKVSKDAKPWNGKKIKLCFTHHLWSFLDLEFSAVSYTIIKWEFLISQDIYSSVIFLFVYYQDQHAPFQRKIF